MLLPKEKTKPSLEFSKMNLALYGKPGVGKSTFCASYPKGLFLNVENGLKALEVYEVKIKIWENFLAVKEELKKPNDFDTIIIDTADLFYSLCDAYVCRLYKVQHTSEDRKSTRLNSSHIQKSRMPSSA